MSIKFTQKYLKANHKLWRFATQGMKEFKCHQCGFCCRTKIVELLPEEYYRLRKRGLKKKHFVKVNLGHYYIAAIKPACPLLNPDNTCSVFGHKDRPFACSAFPMIVNWGRLPEGLQFITSKDCKHIQTDQQYNYSYPKFVHTLKNFFAFYDYSDIYKWQQYNQDIQDLPEYKHKTPYKPRRSWCPICKKPYQNADQHRHQVPKAIAQLATYVTGFGQHFSHQKSRFRTQLAKYLNSHAKSST